MIETKPLDLIVFTDAHYYSKKLGVDTESYKKYDSGNQKMVKDSEEVLKAAFNQMAKSDCTNIIFCGDSTCDGDTDSHAEFISLLTSLKNKGKRIFAITSTHDFQDNGVTHKYTGPVREEIPSVKREDIPELYKNLGPDEAVSVFKDGLSYFAHLDDTYSVFALNSDRDGTGRSGYSEEMREWIVSTAKEARAKGRKLLAFTHHPLVSPSPFYSLIGKNDMMGGHKEIREILADNGINIVFTGHSHVHDISYIFSEKGNVLYDISTSALAGYPGYFRKVRFIDNTVIITSEHVTEPVDIKFNGNNLQDHLYNKFFGTIRLTLNAAAKDIPTFADCACGISIPKKTSYKFGWIIKPIGKFLNKLTVGKIASWTKKETGLKKSDYEHIKNDKVVDFIIDLVMRLYEGDGPYNPETPEYKITVGLMNIIDSILKTIHLPFSKILKGYNSPSDLIIPLLHNSGICDKNATLPLEITAEEIKKICNDNYADTVKPSKKGPGIITALIFMIILLIPFIPLFALIVLIAYLSNRIKYSKEIRGLK